MISLVEVQGTQVLPGLQDTKVKGQQTHGDWQ